MVLLIALSRRRCANALPRYIGKAMTSSSSINLAFIGNHQANNLPSTTTCHNGRFPAVSSLTTSSSGRRRTYSSLQSSSSVDVISISDAYDSGNGEFVSARMMEGSVEEEDCDVAVTVQIKPDP